MKREGCVYLLATTLLLLFLLPKAQAQIPSVCTDEESLENLICCPTTADGVCGEDANRGECVMLDTSTYNYDPESTNVRVNWPHYYTRVCMCKDNYGGYDCSRCKFGYYGPDCSNKQVLPRRPVRDFSAQDWQQFNDIIGKTRTYDSGYETVLQETTPGTADLVTAKVSLYHLYIWIHHYTAKDSQNIGKGTFLFPLGLMVIILYFCGRDTHTCTRLHISIVCQMPSKCKIYESFGK